MKELLTFLRDQADKVISATFVAIIAWVSQREIKKANIQKTQAESRLTDSQVGTERAKENDLVIKAADTVIGRYEERDRALVGRIEGMEKDMRAVITHVVHLEEVYEQCARIMRENGLTPPARPQRPEDWPWSL